MVTTATKLPSSQERRGTLRIAADLVTTLCIWNDRDRSLSVSAMTETTQSHLELVVEREDGESALGKNKARKTGSAELGICNDRDEPISVSAMTKTSPSPYLQ